MSSEPTPSVLLDGRAVSSSIRKALHEDVAELVAATGRRPVLATVLVGDDPASHTYVRMKVSACAKVGLESRRVDMPSSSTTEQVVSLVESLSNDPDVDGILVQHPLPAGVDERAVFEAIDPTKDVDGVTMTSFAAMGLGVPGYQSATPGGIVRLLDAYDIPIAGCHAVVIGRSAILGKPMGLLLLARDATVTWCHSRTGDLRVHVEKADIVVAAAGSAGLVEGDWIKPGAVVIDAGYADNRGDVDFDGAMGRASHITPVPGGVGPMTITTLLAQTVRSAQYRRRHNRI